ncbi:MAG: hypothetical protein ABR553_02890, partial [Gammaproteobacteria bacterium]
MVKRDPSWATQTAATRINRGYYRRYPDEVAEFLAALPAAEAWQALQDLPVDDSHAAWAQLPTDAAEAILA